MSEILWRKYVTKFVAEGEPNNFFSENKKCTERGGGKLQAFFL